MNDEKAALALVRASRLVRAAEGAIDRCAAAWQASLTYRRLVSVIVSPHDSPATRVRRAGCMAISAAATHGAFVGIERLEAAPGSGVGWFCWAVFAAACVVRPDAVVAAWNRSRWRNER